MKSKIFKKIVSAIVSTAMLASMAVMPAAVKAADSTIIYERGTTTAWSDADLTDWTLTGSTEATPVINADYGLYADNNKTGCVTKTFEYSDSAVVTYDVDFYTNSSPGRATNYAYVKFGSAVTVGYNNTYTMFYSVDGGVNYNSTAVTGNVKGKTTNIKAVINTSSNTLLSLTVAGTEIESAANTVLSDATYNTVSMGFVRAGSVNWNIQYALDTIEISEIVDETVYHVVSYNVDGKESSESVAGGSVVANIPDTTKTGYLFQGWAMNGDTDNLLSTEEIAAAVVTEAVSYTAVYEKDPDYIEPIVSAVISGPDLMTIGADADTAAANEYSVELVGELGTVITKDTLDSRVTDFSIEWDIDGFKTENDVTDNSYCDYYGGFESKVTNDVNAVFNLRKNASMNFFGVLKTIVTYNGETITATMPVVAISNTDVPSNQILPRAGYPSDMDAYSNDLLGYESLSETTYGEDIIFGGWNMSGSDPEKSATLMSDETGKFVRVYGETLKKSKVFTNSITSPATQAIFEQDIRFNDAGTSITFTAGNPFWLDKNYSEATTVKFDGTNITLNGVAASMNDEAVAITAGKWYKVVLSVDKTNETAFVNVYDNGELIAKTGNVAWTASCAPTYYGIAVGNANGASSVDLGSYKAYYPVADESTFVLNATQTTLSIPNGDTAELSAALSTADGYAFTGAATWTVLEDDMKDGVIITPDATDSHKAVVTLASTAVAGEATVQVNIGGYAKTVKLNITSSAESVKFTESATSLSIPLDADQTTVVKYVADVVNGQGEELGREVELAIYDKTNTEIFTLPEGITFDATTGTLTITADAKACTFTVRATGKNTDGEEITKSVKVNVHGLAFDFGAGTDEDVAEGYTAITPDSAYTETAGYGISGTVVAGGTATVDNADSDYLEGAITFKADVPAANHYKVEITYQGTLKAEPVNADLTAYTLGSQTTLTKAEYTVPVIDDVLELTISDYTYTADDKDTEDTSDDETATATAQIASIVVTKLDKKVADTKPTLYVIGDSTLSNNGSWGYYLSHNTGNFPELYDIVNVNICGRGGSNLAKYYTSGDFYSRILNNIKPGDIVSLGNMGTNGMGTTFEDNFNYYLDAVEALGAKTMIHSYSPHGAVSNYAGGYDSATQTFESYRKDAYDNTARAIAEERAANDANYLGFVDIGKRADAAFNAYVDDYAANGYADRDAAAQAIIACFSDHNHYSGIASQLIVAGYGNVEGTVAGYVDILEAYLAGDEPTPEPKYPFIINSIAFGADGLAAEIANAYDENYASDATVCWSEYDGDGRLVSVYTDGAEELKTQKEYTFSYPTATQNGNTFKVTVWSSVTGMDALAEAVTTK